MPSRGRSRADRRLQHCSWTRRTGQFLPHEGCRAGIREGRRAGAGRRDAAGAGATPGRRRAVIEALGQAHRYDGTGDCSSWPMIPGRRGLGASASARTGVPGAFQSGRRRGPATAWGVAGRTDDRADDPLGGGARACRRFRPGGRGPRRSGRLPTADLAATPRRVGRLLAGRCPAGPTPALGRRGHWASKTVVARAGETASSVPRCLGYVDVSVSWRARPVDRGRSRAGKSAKKGARAVNAEPALQQKCGAGEGRRRAKPNRESPSPRCRSVGGDPRGGAVVRNRPEPRGVRRNLGP